MSSGSKAPLVFMRPAERKTMSNLIEHARRELEILGEEKSTIEGYLKVVKAFADMGHSGGSAEVAIPVIEKLLRFENLKPLTNNPSEWEDRSEMSGHPLWQNKRNPRFFSTDGGRYCWNVNEVLGSPSENVL